MKNSWLGSSATKALLSLALLFTLAVFSACGTEESAPDDDKTVDVGIGTGAEPTAPGPLDVLAQLDGHFDGKTLTFAPVRDDGALQAQNYDTYGKIALDFAETGSLTFTTTEAIVNNNQGPSCTAAARDYPTTNFADGQNHFLKDSAFSSTACTNGHLCAVVTITNTATNYFDRVYTEVSQFKPSGFRGDNGVQPYNSASNTTGYPKGFGLGVKDGGVDGANDGIWSYGSLAPSSTSIKVRWDFVLPSCADFNFLTTVRGSKRVTKYAVTTTTQPLQDACASGTTLSIPSGNAIDVPVPFPVTIYDKPIASLTVGTYGYLHEGQERTASVTESFASSNTDFPLNTNMAWALAPYWGNVAASQVCTATTGTAPNRSFVVTWKYTLDRPVSAILHETSDQVEFQYGGTARCLLSSLYRGGISTVGIQGNGNTYKRVNFNDSNFLSSTGCPVLSTDPVPTVRMTANGTQSGTGLPPNDPFSGGNSNTNLKIVTSSDYTISANDNRKVCVNLSVSGTSSTPSLWEVRLDLSLPPFNGHASSGDLGYQGTNQVVVSDAGGGFARIYGKGNDPTPSAWRADYNNAYLTSSQTLDFMICAWNVLAPLASNTNPSWYTLAYSQGTGSSWSDTKACVTVTATATVAPSYFPFDFVWQATLDMTAAKKRITDSGHHVNYMDWTPNQQTWTATPARDTKPIPDSFAIVSGSDGGSNSAGNTNLNINNYPTRTITGCVMGY